MNQIPNFHVTNNIVVDVTHDFYEESAHDGVTRFILKCINDGFITLSEINDYKQCFDYDINDVKSLSKEITMDNLKQHKLKTTASQMMCFIDNLTLFFERKVPPELKIFKFIFPRKKFTI